MKIWGGLARQHQVSTAPLSNRPETRDFSQQRWVCLSRSCLSQVQDRGLDQRSPCPMQVLCKAGLISLRARFVNVATLHLGSEVLLCFARQLRQQAWSSSRCLWVNAWCRQVTNVPYIHLYRKALATCGHVSHHSAGTTGHPLVRERSLPSLRPSTRHWDHVRAKTFPQRLFLISDIAKHH